MTAPALVRHATPTDLDSVVPLLVAQEREHGIPVSAAHLAAHVAETLAHPESGLVLLAERDGAVIGVAYGSYARPLEHAGEVAWLEELYVVPAERSHGVGRLLLDEVCARAEARGCVSVELEIAADHARAANLYARGGFRSMQRTHWTRPLSRWDWGDKRS